MADAPLANVPVTPITVGSKKAYGVQLLDNSGNPIVSFGGGSGGTANVDQSAFVVGSGSGTPAMGIYEAAPTSIANGQVGVLGATAKRAMKVTLYDTAGNELSAGGGVQYTEGDTDATLTGTVAMVEGAANAATPLVQPLTDTQLRATSVPVTAAAGTNLNTSALALEAGGNLAGAATSLAVVDDWDESDRAKVNIIVGQAGIAAGAGAVGATVPRVTLASDDPAVATLGATSGAKVITDANGTIQQYLRGLVYQLITAGVTFVTPVPDTVNGWLVANMTSGDGSTALTNTAQAIKASAGKLGGWYIYNPNSSAVYIPIYNVAAGSVTVGTTNPQMVLCIPATSAANVEFAMGIPFTNAGFSAAATTTGGGSTAPTTALEANFFYK